MNHKPRVVVMGGGTGTFPVISALKHLDVDISTVIAVSDSGGSTGRIRDEFGFQPVGDLRQSLASLAESETESWIRKILLYRFEKGEGLKGHNLGNLILTALQDMTGDTTRALEIAEKVFRLGGTVIPVTQENVNLQINYADGTTAVGEHILDEKVTDPKRVDSVSLVPAAELNPLAADAIAKADLIVIGPGDYFASLMATLVVGGIPEVFQQTQAKVLYIGNLMTRITQTHGMTARDHVLGIEKAIQRPVDHVLINTEPISATTLKVYENEGEFPVIDDLGEDARVIRVSVISDVVHDQKAYDTVHRSLLRHDSVKLEAVLRQLLNQ
ncbi:MAG TPA: gluconeogenesis factor YvcK family protein [Vitreimonas sp.]|nr:gluconeogenesis factor YvcK family protein [Vitreimonas sp.]